MWREDDQPANMANGICRIFSMLLIIQAVKTEYDSSCFRWPPTNYIVLGLTHQLLFTSDCLRREIKRGRTSIYCRCVLAHLKSENVVTHATTVRVCTCISVHGARHVGIYEYVRSKLQQDVSSLYSNQKKDLGHPSHSSAGPRLH